MLRRIIQSFLLASQNIRSNFFHTFLSVLGIVIGVAALVSILSLIDGMQEYAKKQISSTTTLNMIMVNSDPVKRVNGMSIRKDSITFLRFQDFQALQPSLTKPAKSYIFHRLVRELFVENDSVRTAAFATAVAGFTPDSILYGRTISQDDLIRQGRVCVLNETLAKAMADTDDVKSMINKKVGYGDRLLTVVGVVLLKNSQTPELFYPFSLCTITELKNNPPQCMVEAENVEDVTQLKSDINIFLINRFTSKHDFKITTNDLRVEQATRGFLLFKIIMGLIVGISVVVGGVGVMNVLLISVTQRTAEIGIRKAVGANRRDIMLLFLSESVMVSAFGSLIGLIFGTLFTMAAIPIITKITEIPFYASYTWDTFLIISVIAIVVGIVFGTYPAIRASRLDPVEAIRHE